ncbi:MAG: NAD-dependent epimerase/dehydratase family protein [Calditrichaeota bacterium]|nr:MAG: NAD-dependent epimerase/dehydratase family protein [Calditrichota bacterium]
METGTADFCLTGATGFVGSWVAQALCDQQAQVTCIIRPTSNLRWLEHLNVSLVRASLLDAGSLRHPLRETRFLFHIAGVTKANHPYQYYQGNVETTATILEAAYRYGKKIEHILVLSSQAAAGPSPGPEPIDEAAPCRPVSEYGKSKYRAEQVAREWMDRLPITILRPPAVYGPRDTDVLEVFKNVARGWDLRVGRTEQQVSLIQVRDLARGIILAGTHPDAVGQTYFIADPQPYFWSQVVEWLARLMKRTVRTIRVPIILAYAVATLAEAWSAFSGKPGIINRDKIKEVAHPYWVVSADKIARELGFVTQIELQAGLEETYRWYREQQWL